MLHSTLLILHISGAVVGLISGTLSMLFRKGSGLHRVAGTFFFASMLCMAGSGAFLATFINPNNGNLMGGLLTCYLVVTGWVAGKRRAPAVAAVDWTSLAAAGALSATFLSWGIAAVQSPTGLRDGYKPGIYFVFGSIALLFAASDVRLVVRGGVAGAQRIARHLWRMGLAFLIAVLSFYPGRAVMFPEWARRGPVAFVPHLLLLGSLIYWLIRTRRRRRVNSEPVIAAHAQAAVAVSPARNAA